jgi:hypothetical protein
LFSAVIDIVVEERRGVDQFDCDRGADGRGMRIVVDKRRQQIHRRANAFTRRRQNVGRHFTNEAGVVPERFGERPLELFEARSDRRERTL